MDHATTSLLKKVDMQFNGYKHVYTGIIFLHIQIFISYKQYSVIEACALISSNLYNFHFNTKKRIPEPPKILEVNHLVELELILFLGNGLELKELLYYR